MAVVGIRRPAPASALTFAVGAQPVAEPCDSCGVRHISVCHALAERDPGRLAELATSLSVELGRVFMQEDDPASAFYNVTSGTARLFKLLADGRRQITGFARPGNFLGLAVSPRYSLSAEAVDHVQPCRFSRPKPRQVMQDFPTLEEQRMEVAVSELAAAQAQMPLPGRKTARERVASFLVGFAESERPCGPARTRLNLAMTRSDIADYLGLTIETVSRTFTRLKSERLIALHGAAEVEILNPAALRHLADAAD